jgi:hypothetical protein
MSCYLRNLEELFKEVGLDFSKENKKTMDGLIKKVLRMSKSNCPDVWGKLKTILADEEKKKSLVEKLKKEVAA